MKDIEKAPSINSLLAGKDEIFFTQVLQLPVLNELVNKVNENYYYWDKVKYLQTPAEFSAADVWLIAKLRRRNSPFRLDFGKHQFTWLLTGQIQQRLHLFDMHIGGSLESRSLIPKDEKNRYLISSIMEEAIASSQIEGAVTTRKKAKEMLRKNKAPKNESEQMIVNNYRTIQKILEIKNENLTIERLLEVHQLISRGTLSNKEDEGNFRNADDINVVDVTDGNIVYSPPSHLDINSLIGNLCDFFNNDKDNIFIHPIIKACIIHFMIGYIHPFVDGNGRTARALYYWYLLKKGYWLTEYLSISKLILKSKGQYAKAFLYTETDDNDLTYFINYKLRTMDLAYQSLRDYIQLKIEEKRQVGEFIKIKGVNERQALILKWFYEEPSIILTVKEVETRLVVSNQTARTDLMGMVAAGFLTTIKINMKTDAFIKSDEFETLLRQRLNKT